MEKDYTKERLCRNVDYLIKKNNIPIGVIERKAKKSPGYYSRVKKRDERTEPSLRLIYCISRQTGIPIEAILLFDIEKISSNTWRVVKLIQKLAQDTFNMNIDWEKKEGETKDFPLSHLIMPDEALEIIRQNPDEEGSIRRHMYAYSSEEDWYVNSHTYSEKTGWYEKFYYANIDSSFKVILVEVYDKDNPSDRAIELYINGKSDWEFLASSKENDLSSLIDNLLEQIDRSIENQETSINDEMKKIIDDYIG